METNNEPKKEIKLTEKMAASLDATRRLTRLISSVLFIIFIVYTVIFVSQIATLGGAFLPMFATQQILLLFLFILVFVAVYFLPTLLLHRYSSSLREMLKNTTAETMEKSFNREHSFWRYITIMIFLLVLVAVITLLTSLPRFTGPNLASNASNCENSMAGVVGAVRSGVALWSADDMVKHNSKTRKNPAKLDSGQDGPSNYSNLFFDEVLSNGIADPNWSKNGQEYSFKCDGKEFVFKYDPETGTFEQTATKY